MADIKIKKSTNAGGTFYDITIDDITICGCKRITGTSAKGDYDFISTPRRKYTAKDGSEKWADIVTLSKNLAAEVLEVVKAEEGEASADAGSKEPF